jgi:hypothetical protein
MRFRQGILQITLVVCLASCVPDGATEAGPLVADITPLCQLGCIDPDPNEDWPGVFLGSGVTPALCTDPSSQQDTDQDGLSDYCEKKLAEAFAPELAYSSLDDLRGEPRWAARPAGDSVVIAYLFAYYTDFAAVATTQCKMTWLFPFAPLFIDCNGHNGDPEQVMLVVSYQASRQHWLLRRARYFHHTSSTDYLPSPTLKYPTFLEYPTHPAAHPRVYASMRKHASYARESECATGGTLASDTCDQTDTYRRIVASATLNIGSRSVHSASQDSTKSTNPSYYYYAGGRYEAFWTPKTFRGWVPDSVGGGGGDSYSGKLASMGF